MPADPDSLAPVLQGTMVASVLLAMQQKGQILQVCAAASLRLRSKMLVFSSMARYHAPHRHTGCI